MKVSATRLRPYPGYEGHVAMNLDTDSGGNVSIREIQETIKAYKLAPGMEMKDIQIPGPEEGQEIRLHLIIPGGLPEKSPVVLDIHGGGYVSGSPEIDNYRNIHIAEHTPCIVASVEYRLATRETPFPAQLLDCHAAYMWLREHAAEIGGDPERIGVHGTSAGGNLSAGLALYLRDHGEPAPALTVLNVPGLTPLTTPSKLMYGAIGVAADSFYEEVDTIYHNPQGGAYSYYAFPGLCQDLKGLGPHMVVTAEYCPLRDEGLDYAIRLLGAKVPCEIISAPRVSHGFCVIDHPLTRWTHNGICASFRREFGMEITDF